MSGTFLQTSKCLSVFSIVFSRVNSKALVRSWRVSLLIAPLEWQDSSIRQNQNSIWQKQERDFGQTLAKHKMNPGVYIVWPFLGPSTVRDTVGLAGDAALNPLGWISYLFLTPLEGFGNYSYDTVNDLSIDKGTTYENITKPAIDPYIALQDAYAQNRIKKIKE